MFDFQFIYTVVLLVLMTIALIREIIEADLIIFTTLILMILGRVITLKEAFAGFSNHGMLTVGFLFIVAGGLRRTGILDQLGHHLLGKRTTLSKKLLRLLFPVAFISAFFNNTPIVAVLIPTIHSWTKKNEYVLSKFLIPISYAAILGGMCTLIGTSTNLVVHGLMLENGFSGMSLFEISRIGVPVAVMGLFIVAFLSHRFLPERKETMAQLGETTREFVVAMKVESDYPHIGKTIQEAGLRHLKGLFLFQIDRQGEILVPIGFDEKIYVHDRLFFTGLPETIIELQKMSGLSLLKEATIDLKNYDSDNIHSYEVVVSSDSPLIGKNVRESNFRGRYDAVILAIHRSGERVRQKIGDVVLRTGDTLLILGRPDFLKKWYHSRDFYLVSKSAAVVSKPKPYAWFSLIILAAMIVSMAFGIVPILISVCVAAILLLISRCITPHDARHAVQWNVLLVIASAFGIAKGLENSGVAYYLANQLISGVGTLGVIGIVGGIYFLTSFYTEIITNNAAAALLFPISLSVARQSNIDPRPLFLTVALAASASFATPIGYQTNLMVYGPGGYRFKDFLKIGIPMNIVIGFSVISLIYLYYFS